MQEFSSFVANARLCLNQQDKEVRVAILDDGIDWFFANEINANLIKCVGTSFYVDKRQDFYGRKAWYSSSNDHGTLMAALIRKICPDVKLYVARLDQTVNEQGKSQPTPDSAADVSKLLNVLWFTSKHD